MKKLTIMTMLAALVGVAQADVFVSGWEDAGAPAALGTYGNAVNPMIVSSYSGTNYTGIVNPHSGSGMLQVTEAPHASTPQVYLAYIENLQEGDIVSASFWGYDDTTNSYPSLRIWGHYAANGDVDSYTGSAGGNSTFTDGSGWGMIDHSWTIPSNQVALVIEARLYSTPVTGDYSTDYLIDDLTVNAPSSAMVTMAGVIPEPATLTLIAIFGGSVLAIRRRMRF